MVIITNSAWLARMAGAIHSHLARALVLFLTADRTNRKRHHCTFGYSLHSLPRVFVSYSSKSMLSFCTEVMVLLMPSVLGVGVLFLKEAPLSPYILRNLRPSSFRIGESIDFIDFNYARMIKSVFSHYYIRNTSLENNCFNCRRNTPPNLHRTNQLFHKSLLCLSLQNCRCV